MKINFKRFNRYIAYCVVIMMMGLVGMIVSTSVVTEDFNEDGDSTVSNGTNLPLSDSHLLGSRGTRISQYIQLSDSSGNPHSGVYSSSGGNPFYLDTQQNNFRVYLKNIYSGDHIEYVNVTLRVTSGVGGVITVTDSDDTDSYMSQYDNEDFQFDIEIGTDANIGEYELALDIEFTAVSEWPWYNHTYHLGTVNIKIKLSSRITTTSSGYNLKLKAMDKTGSNTIALYSGAKNIFISLVNIYSLTGTLDNAEFTLNLPPSFTLSSNKATVNQIRDYVYDDPMWLMTSCGLINVIAQEFAGTLDVTYTRNSVTITETMLQVTIEIVRTPIVNLNGQITESEIGSKSGGEFISNVEIYQGTTTETFSLKFNNEGNIDLRNVEVELYTENAAYFFKSNFYYDENNYAYKSSYGKTLKLGDIEIGKSVTMDFSTEVIKNLPPGLYKIPIKYKAKYNLGGLIDIEINENDIHEDIVEARSGNYDGYKPFLLVHVKEGDDENDKTEPDLMALSTTPLRVGKKNVLLSVELTNLENYRINNVNAEIETGGTSPLQKLNSNNMTPAYVAAQDTDFTMYGANDPLFSNKHTIRFLVDIYKDAHIGTQDVPIKVICLDPFNQERSTMVYVSLNINPIPPSFVLLDASTNDILPNDNFTLTVRLYNSGGSDAKSVMVAFNGSSNLFSAKESIKGPVSIKKSSEAVFEFQVIAGEVQHGLVYISSISISFEDSSGTVYPFNSNPSYNIPLHVKNREPVLLPKIVIADASTTNIFPNKNFTLTLKLYNGGEADAKNVRVMFNGISNLFSSKTSIQGPKGIMVNEVETFEFEIDGGEVEQGKTYSASILISYEDMIGNVYPFEANDLQNIQLYVKKEEVVEEVVEEEPKDEGIDIDEGLALIILGIFLLIGIIVFSVIRAKAAKKEKGAVSSPGEERITPSEVERTEPRHSDASIQPQQYPEQELIPPPQTIAQAPPQPQPTQTMAPIGPGPGQMAPPQQGPIPYQQPPPSGPAQDDVYY